MTTHLTYARSTVRGPRLLLTATIALVLAIGMFPMAGSTANAAQAPSLGAADSFAILSAADGGGGAVTCVGPATINGNIGSSGVITPGTCTINGSQTAPVSAAVVAAFDSAYAALHVCGAPRPSLRRHSRAGDAHRWVRRHLFPERGDVHGHHVDAHRERALALQGRKRDRRQRRP